MKQRLSGGHIPISSGSSFNIRDQKAGSSTKEKTGSLNAYWFMYPYMIPYIPMMDLTFAFDALKNIFHRWLPPQKTTANLYKKADQ